MSPLFKRFELNTQGRDFAVGDIHGCYVALDRLLKRVDFDQKKDRLFGVGDLMDRGPTSERFADYLDAPWFKAIRGNHDQMMLDAERDEGALANWHHNGGSWSLAFTASELTLWRDRIDLLPVAIEIMTRAGKVGIVHADPVVPTWRELKASLSVMDQRRDSDRFFSWQGGPQFEKLMWSRELASTLVQAFQKGIDIARFPDLDALIIGHTPLRAPLHIANFWMIDTGAGYPKERSRLTLLDLNTFETYAEPTYPV
jgi:serine/threonine protein phosphatase 1